MSGSLTTFAAHCRQMATAQHKPECHAYVQSASLWRDQTKRVEPDPDCDGCNPATDRALFALLAAEVDDYLAPTEDLFGDLSHEPTATDDETPAGGMGEDR